MSISIDNTVNDSITTNGQSVILDVRRHVAATVTLTGAWSGTIQFETTTDNVTWVSVTAAPIPSGSTVTSATANGTWLVNVAAFASMRLRASSWTSGTAGVAVRASVGSGVPVLVPGSIPYAGSSGQLTGDANFTRDPVTGALKLFDRSGDLINYSGTAFSGRKTVITDGTAAAPVTEWGSTILISRTENLTLGSTNSGSVNNGMSNSNQVLNDVNAALNVVTINKGTSQMQSTAILGAVRTYSSVVGSDAAGVIGQGRAMAGAVGRAGAFYGESIRDTTSSTTLGMELRTQNNSTTDSTYNATGLSDVAGIWLTNAGKRAGEAIGIVGLGGAGHEYLVGIAFKPSGVLNESIRDDSSAVRSVAIGGSHTYGLDLSGSVISAGAIRMANAQQIIARNAANSGELPIIGLDTNNRVSLGGNTLLPNNTALLFNDAAGVARNAMYLASDNTFHIGLDSTPSSAGNTIIHAGGAEAARWNPTSFLFTLQGSVIWGADNTNDVGSAAKRPRDFYLGRDAYITSVKPNTGTTQGIAIAPTLTPGASAADGTAIGGGVLATGSTTPGTYTNVHVIAATKTGTGVPPTAVGLAVDVPTIGTTNIAATFGGDVQFNSKTLNFYDLGGGFVGKPASAAVDMPIPIPRALTIPANMSGAQAIAKTGATASAAFTIAKVSSGVTTTIGTLTFAAGGQGAAQAGTFTTPSGAAQSLAAGDYVIVTAPTQDATLADIGWVITGTWY